MFKYLIVFCLIGLMLIYMGNHFDLQRNRITQREYNRRVRFFFILLFIIIGVLLYLRKR